MSETQIPAPATPLRRPDLIERDAQIAALAALPAARLRDILDWTERNPKTPQRWDTLPIPGGRAIVNPELLRAELARRQDWPKTGLRYWCSRAESTPGRGQFHSQGYGKPNLKYGCTYCRGEIVTEAGHWVVFTRDPATLAYTQEVPRGRFPGRAAAERRVQQMLDADGYGAGFVARWVPQPIAESAKPGYNEGVTETQTPGHHPAEPDDEVAYYASLPDLDAGDRPADSCGWMFHGVTRRDNGDGTVTLTLDGWRYTSSAERDPGDTAACLWCSEPVTRRFGRWYAADGEDCPDAGPDGLHYIKALPATARAAEPCATVTVPLVTEVRAGETWIIYESTAAYDLARAHCGDHYTVVWQGRGWTVEIESGYPLWRVTS